MKRETRGESGFALIVALLALMLLTFLGLTLAMTTSTELQIASNYRWGQQALYNAEAGVEVARAVMAQVGDGQLLLPDARTAPWDPNAGTINVPTARFSTPQRNFENSYCDKWGAGAGYGQVLVDPNNPTAPFENMSTVFGHTINGTFTVWIRRELSLSGNQFIDNPAGENVVVTSEGSAPFQGDGAFQRANRAIRRIEATVNIAPACDPGKGQGREDGSAGCLG